MLGRRAATDRYCTDGEFFDNQISDASPSVADCRRMIDRLLSERDQYQTPRDTTQKRVAWLDSCAFGIELTEAVKADDGKACRASVNHLDVVAAVVASIQWYAWGDRVGTRGDMWCVGDRPRTDRIKVRWGLYHASY